jgi:phosphoribosylformylglycinamidine synthase
MTGNTGAMLSLMDDSSPVSLLFSETQSRIVLSISPENLFLLEKIAVKHRVPLDVIGKVGGNDLIIKKGSKTLIDVPVKDLSETYYGSIEKTMEVR